MLLNLFSLKKRIYTSAASRNIFKFYNKLNYQQKKKQLTFFKIRNSGRNDSGKIIIRTKTSLLVKQKFIKINYNFRYLKLGFLSSFQFIPFRNKLLSLFYFSNGSFTYFISNENQKLFSFIYFNFSKKMSKIKINNIFFMILQIQKLSFISCLELIPGINAQYVLSSGTKARIIKFDYDNHSTMIQLPSGIKKIFSYYSFVMLDRISLPDHSLALNGKAGY